MRTVTILESENQALKERVLRLERVAEAAREVKKYRMQIIESDKGDLENIIPNSVMVKLNLALSDLDKECGADG